LVAIHPHKPQGSRSTDPAAYPPACTTDALRATDGVVSAATGLDEFDARFTDQLLARDFPGAKLRPGQKLLRLGERYSPARVCAACERALAVDLIDVSRVERMLKEAIEQKPPPLDVPDARCPVLPLARFARAGRPFDHR
jgi:hypothetical protein